MLVCGGHVHSLALSSMKEMWAWGSSRYEAKPTLVECLQEMEDNNVVALGWGHAFALTKDGRSYGWGFTNGRLGQACDIELSSSLGFTSPVVKNVIKDTDSLLQVGEKLVSYDIGKEKIYLIGVDVADIACGLDHYLILIISRSLLSYGNNTYSQLGRTSRELSLGPVDIKEQQIISIYVGLGHSIALCHRSLWVWKVGDIVSVCGGPVHLLALSSMKEVWAWSWAKPALVICLQDMEVIQISSGFDHSLMHVAGHSR
ncbi:hypothetical protein AMTRI_Chr13g124380 [Amborella trichopoda]